MSFNTMRCPFCNEDPHRNEYWIRVQRLGSSKLCLSLNQTYPGQCLLIYQGNRHVTSLDDLSVSEYFAYMQDLRISVLAIRMTFRPDHMNVELLGNVQPHLHFHIIPRYRSDPRWNRPIWITEITDMPKTLISESEYEQRVALLRSAVETALLLEQCDKDSEG